jgi:hypothetical protein
MNTATIIKGKRKGISNIVSQFVTFIDLEKRMYKIQESLFGIFKWGDFEPLPKIDYVLVFKQFFAKCEVCEIDEDKDNAYSFYQVSLVHHKNRRIIVHETKNKEEAFNLGKEMALALQTRVRDSASVRGKSVWI